ncbi:glycine N-acyltransferase-like protein 3 [Sardina pilchardus]|uniref:glycine N-acyltransferase-like protein 3 n=1 Tax=Sardina pilchardus TaxID=27697 RepID=UPI002E134232
MEILNEEQLTAIETLLQDLYPQSLQVYGYIFQKNRVKSDHMDVLVDRWPDFRTVLIRPQRKKKEDFFKDICVFSKDGETLRKLFLETEIVDWQNYLCLGVDLGHAEIITSIAATRGATGRNIAVCHMLRLENPSHLPLVDSSTVSISSLEESHISLVNETWKFGEGEHSLSFIKNMICHFPTCCILDASGTPVAWVLTYAYCAMGMLYTRPEHRRKGYAKILISVISKRLHAQGYPVFCFIEEENQLSYKLFQSLGFKEDPSYRATWFNFN